MNFIYFIPNHKKPSIELAELDAIGLGHIHDGVGMTATPISGFIVGEKRSDCLLITAQDSVSPDGTAATLAYNAGQQTWRRGKLNAAGEPLFYVGYWTDKKPMAESLVRKKSLGGTAVLMLDDHEWIVPIAASKLGMVSLPLQLVLNDKDQWAGQLSPQYKHLGALAGKAYDRLLDRYLGRAQAVSFDDSMIIAEAALSVIYRVGRFELAMLGCVGSESLTGIMEAICDWGSFREGVDEDLKKYLAAASSNTASGAPADSPDTNPAGPTSDSTPSNSPAPAAAV